MNISSWQNVVLSVAILAATSLLVYSAFQLFKLKGLQKDNINITWLLYLNIAVILFSLYFLIDSLKLDVSISSYLSVALLFVTSLILWFASKAGNEIAKELMKASALEHYHATHDDLTGLPNLKFFNDQLEKTLGLSRRDDDEFALLIIGLNRFKVINETLGYFVGDAILVEIAQRIRASLRKTDLIARLSGDEFAVLINPVEAEGHVHAISKNIAESIQEPLAIDDKPADVGVGIGVALYPKHAKNSIELIEKARNAMMVAERGGHSVFVYESNSNNEYVEDIQIVGMLQRAIQMQQFKIYYQPQICLRTQKMISVEALIRWQHPSYGLLNPGRFIPYAEKAGLIFEINLQLFKEITQVLNRWQEKNTLIPIAFNITANSFLNVDFQTELKNALGQNNSLAKKIKIELTETSRIDNIELMQLTMAECKKYGLKFSLDDYGTKHASLEYLKKLPFDELKIDQTFMINAASDEDSRAIIQHAKEIADQLNIATTAEGIESEEVYLIAKEYGINNGQGFYFSPAISEDKLFDYV